jgi:Ser/Thr protein kinase RdoA (MazF antagonist)
MDVVVQHAPQFGPVEAETLARRHFGVTASAERLPSERDQNFRLTTADERRFVLKIANATERPEILEFQNAALEHLASREPALAVPRLMRSVSGESVLRAAPTAASTSSDW